MKDDVNITNPNQSPATARAIAPNRAPPAMPHIVADEMTGDCAGREIFNHLTSRWGLLTIVALSDGPQRYYVLRNRLDGISEKMLSQTLRTLTRDGLVTRSVVHTIPPQVTYALTGTGNEIAPLLANIVRWLGTRITSIADAQQEFDHASAAEGQTSK